jgi:cysteine desulfurase / selenocysteine lyase
VVLNDPRVAHAWRSEFVGLDLEGPLLDGRLARFVNFDNAASTPPLRPVVEAIERFLPFYAAVHRGTGFKARISTAAYDEAHETIARFVGAAPDTNTVIIGRNTTDAINKLAWRFPLAPDSVIVSTIMEHHSNDLPWRRRGRLVRARVRADGRLDEDHFDALLAQFGRRVALVTITGASNVTGYVQPIHRLARKAHASGAKILVDAAQLAPHRRIDVRPDDDPEHLDFVALSAHKMYAPFGAGALIGPRALFQQGEPEYQGGGAIEVVTATDVLWAGAPDRDEAGSPNVIGALALAVAARTLRALDQARVQEHEAAIHAYALRALQSVPGLRVYGDADPDPNRLQDRVAVISFNLESLEHGLVAAILGYEGGVGVRSGCFCAQQYVAHLLGLTAADEDRRCQARRAGLPWPKPGMVRASFGLYNTIEEVDVLVDMLHRIARGEYRGLYEPRMNGAEYVPINRINPSRQDLSRISLQDTSQ